MEGTSMTYHRLGKSGLKVSKMSYGNAFSWRKGEKTDEEQQQIATALVKQCWEAGVNFFDTAEVYGDGEGERKLGVALKALGVARSDYVVTTKIFWGFQDDNNANTMNNRGTSRKRLVEGTERSLKNLQMDYVDVLFCHRYDWETPVLEVVLTMKSLIEQGKALYWGTSAWPVERVMEAILLADSVGAPRPICEQCQYSMVVRDEIERNYVALFDDYNYGTMIWSPLLMGVLTGKYNDGIPADSRLAQHEWLKDIVVGMGIDIGNPEDPFFGKLRKLKTIADGLGCTQGQLALAWAMASKDVTNLILGAKNAEQLTENIAALQYVEKLTPEILSQIEEILDNRPKAYINWRTDLALPARR